MPTEFHVQVHHCYRHYENIFLQLNDDRTDDDNKNNNNLKNNHNNRDNINK